MVDQSPLDDSQITKPFVRKDLAEGYSLLWAQRSRPSLDHFLKGAGRLSPAELGAILRVDQEHRFDLGERVATEDYFVRYPDICLDSDAAVDLIYSEYLLRERLGDSLDTDEFVRRFPDHAKTLESQIELHKAMATQQDGQSHLSLDLEPPTPRDPRLSHWPPESTPPPREFGRYRILGALGRGGMGTVYRALDTQLDRVVALKVPHLGHAADHRLIERFYREARAAACFNHPNLCPIHDIGQHDGVHYLTMPLLSGELLSKRLERLGLLPEKDAIRVAARIARGLYVAHRAGVVHRDLKPANVMIGEDEEPIVMDFGLARSDTGNADIAITKVGDILGTPGYMAPEQISGDSKIIGPASDVYSLGVMLYQMLTGRLPFLGPIQDIWRQVLSNPPIPPSQIRQDLSPSVEAVCLKALSKNPTDRFPTMESLAEALDACASSDKTKENPLRSQPEPDQDLSRSSRLSSIDKPHSKWLGGRLKPLIIAIVFVSLLLLGVGYAILDRDEARPKASPVIAQDPLPAGTSWSGEFKFRPPNEGFSGDVRIWIETRDGPRFEGTYRTENGAYEWQIRGTVLNGSISWDFTKAIKDNAAHDVVGRARVYGRIRDRVMTLVFWQSDIDIADMTLVRDDP